MKTDANAAISTLAAKLLDALQAASSSDDPNSIETSLLQTCQECLMARANVAYSCRFEVSLCLACEDAILEIVAQEEHEYAHRQGHEQGNIDE